MKGQNIWLTACTSQKNSKVHTKLAACTMLHTILHQMNIYFLSQLCIGQLMVVLV